MEITEKQKCDFFDSMFELSQLYGEVKKIILLAEYEGTNKGSISLASMNDIRNSFDHVMRYFANLDQGKEELLESREHLFRAAYSSYELVIISKLNFLMNIRKNFSIDDIEKIYPQYFTKVLPIVEETKILLAQSRNKKDFKPNLDLFTKYGQMLDSLNKEMDILLTHFPALNELKLKNTSRRYKSLIINVIIGILSALVSGISLYFILNK